ncbi:hypothetical protein [Riemerella columbipharyngis]|uniref:Uncharacterized protein n=1 Tax=Riemerella columbipharyngis TaxID=1071918 RepID=A0A1G6ZFZ6_9FLAO|nr:hypothetical protein [Riemerella columbipharyngis]SDE00967.1 hypothetical protein SAMN05421544_10255 [Riemerella columbipharyngis]SDE01283.1 hypothetical protein SAMN05421544_10265 [Riemerella columbipharyngis]
MEKSKNLYGQINFDELINAVRSGKVKTSIVTKKDGTKFRAINVNVWINEVPKFGQDASITTQNKKEYKEEKNYYIGNLKFIESKVKEASPDDFEEDNYFEML